MFIDFRFVIKTAYASWILHRRRTSAHEPGHRPLNDGEILTECKGKPVDHI